MKILSYLQVWIIGWVLWAALVFPAGAVQYGVGALVAAVSALFTVRFVKGPIGWLHPRRLLGFLIYLPVFLYELIKANVLIALTVLHPRLPIRPSIVAAKTRLKRDFSKAMLANSITLTPGTLTVDADEDHLYIHVVTVDEPEKAEKDGAILQPFESHVERIAE